MNRLKNERNLFFEGGKYVINEIMTSSPVFFMGASSGAGFYSCFDDIYDADRGDRVFILKGGPGTGKSTLMKHIAQSLCKKGEMCEFGICSSDPESLDVVRFEKSSVVICDGTSPHTMDPKYPGVCENIAALGDFFDINKLKENGDEIIALTKVNSALHKKAGRYLAAAASLAQDSYSIVCSAADSDAINAFSLRLTQALIPDAAESDEPPRQVRRLLSAVTSKGHIFLKNTLGVMCDRVVLIEDEYGAVSSAVMNSVVSAAYQKGYDTVICPCPLCPAKKIDHVIIPELKLGFSTANRYLTAGEHCGRITHARRFIDTEALKKYRQRLSFNKRAMLELLDGAYLSMKDAKSIHDDIEFYYTSAMDFSKVEQLEKRILSQI